LDKAATFALKSNWSAAKMINCGSIDLHDNLSNKDWNVRQVPIRSASPDQVLHDYIYKSAGGLWESRFSGVIFVQAVALD